MENINLEIYVVVFAILQIILLFTEKLSKNKNIINIVLFSIPHLLLITECKIQLESGLPLLGSFNILKEELFIMKSLSVVILLLFFVATILKEIDFKMFVYTNFLYLLTFFLIGSSDFISLFISLTFIFVSLGFIMISYVPCSYFNSITKNAFIYLFSLFIFLQSSVFFLITTRNISIIDFSVYNYELYSLFIMLFIVFVLLLTGVIPLNNWLSSMLKGKNKLIVFYSIVLVHYPVTYKLVSLTRQFITESDPAMYNDFIIFTKILVVGSSIWAIFNSMSKKDLTIKFINIYILSTCMALYSIVVIDVSTSKIMTYLFSISFTLIMIHSLTLLNRKFIEIKNLGIVYKCVVFLLMLNLASFPFTPSFRIKTDLFLEYLKEGVDFYICTMIFLSFCVYYVVGEAIFKYFCNERVTNNEI